MLPRAARTLLRTSGLGLALSCAPARAPEAPRTRPAAEAAANDERAVEDEDPVTRSFVAWSFRANEGVELSIRRGDAPPVAVLIDALVGDGLPGYEAPSPTERAALLERYGSPTAYAAVFALATHHHGDHFEPTLALQLLQRNPNAQLITTPQAVAGMRVADADAFARVAARARAVLPPEGAPRTLELGPDLRLRVLNLHHGRRRAPPVEHLGFLLRVGDEAYLHLGDTELSVDELAALDLADVAPTLEAIFMPYWHLLDEGWSRVVVRGTHRAQLAALHVPRRDAPAAYFQPFASQAELLAALRERSPVEQDLLVIPVAGSEARSLVFLSLPATASRCDDEVPATTAAQE